MLCHLPSMFLTCKRGKDFGLSSVFISERFLTRTLSLWFLQCGECTSERGRRFRSRRWLGREVHAFLKYKRGWKSANRSRSVDWACREWTSVISNSFRLQLWLIYVEYRHTHTHTIDNIPSRWHYYGLGCHEHKNHCQSWVRPAPCHGSGQVCRQQDLVQALKKLYKG